MSLNKQCSSYILVREKLVAEGWKYIELCDEYKGKDYKHNFTKFCEEMKILRKVRLKENSIFKS